MTKKDRIEIRLVMIIKLPIYRLRVLIISQLIIFSGYFAVKMCINPMGNKSVSCKYHLADQNSILITHCTV